MEANAVQSDSDLVAAARAGSRPAFGELVERHKALVFSFAYALVGNAGESEEVAQDALVVAWQRLPRLRRPEHFRGWLCGIVRNVHHRFRRTQRRRLARQAKFRGVEADEIAAEPSPLDRAISAEEQHILQRALGDIPESYRLPLVLYYQGQQSIDQVAEALELSVRTAAKRVSIARKMLAERISIVDRMLPKQRPRKELTAAVLAAISLAGIQQAAAASRIGGDTAVKLAVAGLAVAVMVPLAVSRLGARAGRVPPTPAAIERGGASPGAVSAHSSPLAFQTAALLDSEPASRPEIGRASVFGFDFEDGIMPPIFTEGHLVPGPPRAGNRFCLMGTRRPNWFRYAEVVMGDVMDLSSDVLHHSATIAVSFDYWVDDDGPDFVRLSVYDHDKSQNFGYELAVTVKKWGHGVIRFVDLKGKAPRMDEGDRLRTVDFESGARFIGRPFYLDNIRITNHAPEDLPAASTAQVIGLP